MSHFITLEEAIQMTKKYRKERDNILKPEYAGKNILPNAGTFSRDAFDTLLATPGCVSVRIYHGMDTNMQLHSVIVAVDANNNDILPSATLSAATTANSETVILDKSTICPPFCPDSSPLNS